VADEPQKEGFSPLATKLLWVDKPKNVTLLIKGLLILCVLLGLLDFVIHRHAYFSYEKWYGFYALSGFIAFSVIVLAAKNLRRLIGRDEAYYGAQAVDSETYPEAGLQRQNHRASGAGEHDE